MEETVASLSLAVHEKLELKKNRLSPLPGNDSGKRICVVTGVHGDELEGQYVVYLLNRRIQAHPELLTGTVDCGPARPKRPASPSSARMRWPSSMPTRRGSSSPA